MGVYVVTGGSGGIGGKTVEILRSQGHEVVNVDLKDSVTFEVQLLRYLQR